MIARPRPSSGNTSARITSASLASNARKVAKKLGMDFELVKVTEIDKIIGYGVMMTPALVIDGQVKFSGKLVSPDEIRGML